MRTLPDDKAAVKVRYAFSGKHCRVDAQRFAAALRAVRHRRGWSQAQLAVSARVSQSTVSRMERGHLGSLSIAVIERATSALDLRAELRVRWRGGELDRLLDRGHAALGCSVLEWLAGTGWDGRPEVSFSHFGERGVIDILAWHAQTRSLLVIELKTALVDLQDLIGSMDRKQRLALVAAQPLGWSATSVSGLVIVGDGRTNRRRVAEHRQLLRAAFPVDGRSARGWMRRPIGSFRGLAFWPVSHPGNARQPRSGESRIQAAD
jgi:transcriptional regulator with XRE-family HTH domain